MPCVGVCDKFPDLCSLLTTDVHTSRIGKVHGSLARAGKVRGQTPKVRG